MVEGETVPSDSELTLYREHLVLADQKALETFGKTLIALSGGALGVSFTFLKNIVGKAPMMSPGLLLAAWLCWAACLSVTLLSYYLSHRALRKAMSQVDKKTIYAGRPGGGWTIAINVSNLLSGLLFLCGVVLMSVFSYYNLEGAHDSPRQEQGTNDTATTKPESAHQTKLPTATTTAQEGPAAPTSAEGTVTSSSTEEGLGRDQGKHPRP